MRAVLLFGRLHVVPGVLGFQHVRVGIYDLKLGLGSHIGPPAVNRWSKLGNNPLFRINKTAVIFGAVFVAE